MNVEPFIGEMTFSVCHKQQSTGSNRDKKGSLQNTSYKKVMVSHHSIMHSH